MQRIHVINLLLLFFLCRFYPRSLHGTFSVLAAPTPVHGIQYTKNLGPGSEPLNEKMNAKVSLLVTDARRAIELMNTMLLKAMAKNGNSREIVHGIFNVEADLGELLTMVEQYDGSSTMITSFDSDALPPGAVSAVYLGRGVSTTKGFWKLDRYERVVNYIHELCHHQGGTDHWAWLDGYVVPVFGPVSAEHAQYLTGYSAVDYWTVKAYSHELFYLNPDAWRTFAYYVLMLDKKKTGRDLYPPDLPLCPKDIPGPPPTSHTVPHEYPDPHAPYANPAHMVSPHPPAYVSTYGIWENPYGIADTTEPLFTYQDAVWMTESHAGSEEFSEDQGGDAGGSKKKKDKQKSKGNTTHKKSSTKPSKTKAKKLSIREKMLKYISGQQKRKGSKRK